MKTLAAEQLGKSHADQLLPATKVLRANLLTRGQTRERLAVDPIEDLLANVVSGVYGASSLSKPYPLSNAWHRFC